MSYAQQAVNPVRYKMQEVMGARPEQLTLFLYDHAVQGCKKRDEERASRALAQLIDSLNFEYEEVAAGLFRLYEYSIRRIKVGDFDVPLQILSELRDSWAQAIKLPGRTGAERSIAVAG